MADHHGLITEITLGAVPADGILALDVPLPENTAWLVGLGAGLRLPPGFGEVVPGMSSPPEPMTARWHWADLAVVDDRGATIGLDLPATWTAVHHPDQPPADEVPAVVRPRAEASIEATVLPHLHRPQNVPFRLTAAPANVPAVPALFTPHTLAAVGGDTGVMVIGGVTVRVAGVVDVLPGTADGQGVAVDLSWLTQQRFAQMRDVPVPNEWWVATADPAGVRAEVAQLPVGVHDRVAETDRLLGDPLGSGVLLTLLAAAAGAGLLAAFGLVVDSRANAVRRQREHAVLHTLGVPPSGLARALVVEQAVLAGLGVAAGVAVGVAVAAAMGTSLVLTPAGAVPVPEPLLALSPAGLAPPAVGLFAAAVVLGALVARRARREVAAGALRMGED